jgi:hypothetical protein
MLSLFAALLLSGPLPARADNPAAPPIDLSADANGDGTVSGKERRQKRRAERRARRGAKPDGTQMSDKELDAADAAESSARGGAASNSAASAADAMKSSLPPADDVPGAAGSSPDAKTGARPARSETAAASAAPKATNDPGKPNAPSDYALAARSGYAPAFAAAGLKPGPDGKSVVRLDGKPATPEDYARLKSEIASMPAALGRRPDFFSAVSPAHYADLKQGYKARKDGDPVYKDVALTEGDRDFVHSASCDKLSGECNKSVEKASYKKGDFVAPEDLDNMWDALQKELDGSAEAAGMPDPGAARARAARDTAIGAAIALSPASSDAAAAASSGPQDGKAPPAAPVTAAVASARRFLKTAFAAIVPGAAGAKAADSAPSLALGAIALAALMGGALFLRRKG